jgi:hypothetical protein
MRRSHTANFIKQINSFQLVASSVSLENEKKKKNQNVCHFGLFLNDIMTNAQFEKFKSILMSQLPVKLFIDRNRQKNQFPVAQKLNKCSHPISMELT